jgi:patatin-related protein
MENEAELRLALVCYGGVSLAVYMHGVTKELHKLIRAARAFDKEDNEGAPNPFRTGSAPYDTEAVYYDALRDLAAAGRPLRVAIDIIGGTSAGGINGVALSKALARDASLDSLTKLWIDEGDLRKLLNAPSFAGLRVQAVIAAVRQLISVFSPVSPLRGDRMSRLLRDALKAMDRGPKDANLLPENGTLTLYVTTTDLTGFEVLVPSGSGGASQRSQYNAQVLEFNGKQGELEQFGPDYTPELAFAGRATASFPGAFAPVSWESFNKETGQELDLHTAIFRYAYHPVDEAADTYFVDGGVLDNAPFDLVIDAISHRRAETEVYRRIVYIEPDPGRPLDAPPPQQVSAHRRWLTDLLAVNKVRGSHPILLDLLKLRDLNWRIAEVGAITERQMAYVQEEIADARKSIVPGIGDAVLTSPNLEQPSTATAINALTEQLTAPDNIQTLSDTMHDRAKTALGPTWQTYQRLKFEAAIRRLADELAKKLCLPDKSAPASFIGAVLMAWVRQHPAWKDGGEELSELLRATDVPYRERRLMFILAGINALYRGDGAKGAPPPRRDLDEMKTTAWTMLERLGDGAQRVVRGFNGHTVEFFQRIDDETMLTNPDKFVQKHIEEFDSVFKAYRVALMGPLHNDSFELWKVFKKSTATWDDDDKQALLSRYLGFPLWDGLIFPTISLTELPQLTPIGVAQFSPLAATALYAVENGKKTAKLKGIPLHHFAAFMNAASRENDYLWGRLDGAELILRNLQAVDDTRHAASAGPTTTLPPLAEAFTCVLNTETALKRIPNELRDSLNGQIKNLS